MYLLKMTEYLKMTGKRTENNKNNKNTELFLLCHICNMYYTSYAHIGLYTIANLHKSTGTKSFLYKGFLAPMFIFLN